MLKNSDVLGLTRNLEMLYSRHMICSAFLLGSPTFSSATLSKLTSTCYDRTALHFHLYSEFAFQASPTWDCLSHVSVSCLCLSLLLQSSHCFNSRNLSLFPVLPLVCCSRVCRKKAAFLFFSSLQEKTLSKEKQQLVKKPLLLLQGNLRGCCAYPLFLITVLLRGCHSHPDLFVSSLFP